MQTNSTYNKIIENLTFLKNRESLDVIDWTLDKVNADNLSFIDGFL